MSVIVGDFRRAMEGLFSQVMRMRETAGGEAEALRALGDLGREMCLWLVRLKFEQALVCQHLIMTSSESDKQRKEEGLTGMGEAIAAAEKLIEENQLDEWRSRLHRFKGRLLDYQEKYSEAREEYSRAIEHVESDPDYIGNPQLAAEYRAFIAFDDLMISGVDKLVESKNLFDEFETADWGRELKTRDYFVWAVWRSGVAVRAGQALVKLGLTNKMKELAGEMLTEAERILTDEYDFGYRKKEIADLRKLMS